MLSSSERIGYAIPVVAAGYTLAPFAVLAAFSPKAAGPLFALVILVATALTALGVSRMSPIPLPASFAIIFFGTALYSLSIGEPVPVVIAGLTVAALELRLGRPRRAALAALLAMMQPQIALPVLVAMFVLVPRTRMVVLAGCVVLALLNVLILGVSRSFEYLALINMNVRAEVSHFDQYSLTALLSILGAPANLALALGQLTYLAGVGLSVLIVGMRRERAVDSGALVFLPASFAVTGGSYVHLQQVAAALVAALVLLRPSTFAMSLAIAVLVQSWSSTLRQLPILLAAIWCLSFYTSRATLVRFPARRATLCTGTILAYFGVLYGMRPRFGSALPGMLHDPSSLATLEWVLGSSPIGTRFTIWRRSFTMRCGCRRGSPWVSFRT